MRPSALWRFQTVCAVMQFIICAISWFFSRRKSCSIQMCQSWTGWKNEHASLQHADYPVDLNLEDSRSFFARIIRNSCGEIKALMCRICARDGHEEMFINSDIKKLGSNNCCINMYIYECMYNNSDLQSYHPPPWLQSMLHDHHD